MKYYTGVGARSTPVEIGSLMESYAQLLAQKKYILRSGGADGADTYFERGCDLIGGQKEIYLPWRGFNGNSSDLFEIPSRAFDLAAGVHPAWNYLKLGVKKLHARNILQVLGLSLDQPSEFVICWTSNGKPIGGTATAINFALSRNIKVFNLFHLEDREELFKFVEGMK